VKPSVIVETGVDKGLGACVLAAALLKNADDGHRGRYYGTDINPRAGYLLTDRYATVAEILVGDSIGSLQQLGETIDVFINDSDHSAAYEGREYATIESMLSERGIVIGDNAHANDELLKFAARTGRTFLYFAENPKDHWYPGGGIGAAFTRSDHA
jgi:predicted O-methyltransferase YrrM